MSALEERPLTRREQRQLLRGERDGSGPVREELPVRPHPGAAGAFGLLGEVLVTGLLITIVGLAIITLPAGLAAGVRHLRRVVAAEDSRISLFWRDVRSALLPGAVVGAAALALVGLLLVDIDLAQSGILPGGPAVLIVGWLGIAASALFLLAMAGEWAPERGWRRAFRGARSSIRADIAGAAYLVATAGFVVTVTWALVPLFIPAIGCAALAVVAVPARRRGRQASGRGR